MRKKIFWLLLSSAFISNLNAAELVEETLPALPPLVAVTMPQQIGSFSFIAEGLYQTPKNGDFHYATLLSTTTAITPTLIDTEIDSKVKSIDPEFHWGWHAGVIYHFPGNGQDIEFGWTHFHVRDVAHLRSSEGTLLLAPSLFTPQLLLDTLEDWDEVKASSRNNYDAVDIVYGQKLEFGNNLVLRTFGGIRYAAINLKNSLSAEVVEPDGVGNFDVGSLDINFKSKFQGLGPRAGIDAYISLSRYFSLTGTVGGSLLMGDMDRRLHLNLDALDTSVPFALGLDVDSKIEETTHVIPELDARIALDFTYPFRPDMAFSIQLGYDIANYFNVRDLSAIRYFDTTDHSTNFAVQGPYIRLQLDVV